MARARKRTRRGADKGRKGRTKPPAARSAKPSKPKKRRAKSRAKAKAPARSVTRARRAAPVARARRAPVVAPFRLDIVSFNTHGAVDRSGQVQAAVGPFLKAERPMVACFQELFFRDGLEQLDRELLADPVVFEQAEENLELARGGIGGAYRRRVAWIEENIAGAGAGLAIYTSFPFKNAKFYPFEGLQVPDLFSIKGVLKIEMTIAGFTFVVATTHFNDSENDAVDGRARLANIETVRKLVEDAGDLPIVLVGDFNINAAARNGLDAGLFRSLKAAGGRQWVEAGAENARQNGLAVPVPTVANGRACIDFLLGSAPSGSVSMAAGTYRARDPFRSDHRLVRATMEFS